MSLTPSWDSPLTFFLFWLPGQCWASNLGECWWSLWYASWAPEMPENSWILSGWFAWWWGAWDSALGASSFCMLLVTSKYFISRSSRSCSSTFAVMMMNALGLELEYHFFRRLHDLIWLSAMVFSPRNVYTRMILLVIWYRPLVRLYYQPVELRMVR